MFNSLSILELLRSDPDHFRSLAAFAKDNVRVVPNLDRPVSVDSDGTNCYIRPEVAEGLQEALMLLSKAFEDIQL
ncbi:hypothetical protein IQ268_28070 [Oculatella sp. LEGE 06141]|uniref:hypothetical protein n=1 Tax=Oculatella sp. LEGE 06141 TaxID=1828648 RepID=UPI00187EEF21|nr:hypothetical protein [Oculatella sp. LEGE 06141]MBE9182409.1 hypothetical protein [Oculatella sp. LEGE 06141]